MAGCVYVCALTRARWGWLRTAEPVQTLPPPRPSTYLSFVTQRYTLPLTKAIPQHKCTWAYPVCACTHRHPPAVTDCPFYALPVTQPAGTCNSLPFVSSCLGCPLDSTMAREERQWGGAGSPGTYELRVTRLEHCPCPSPAHPCSRHWGCWTFCPPPLWADRTVEEAITLGQRAPCSCFLHVG